MLSTTRSLLITPNARKSGRSMRRIIDCMNAAEIDSMHSIPGPIARRSTIGARSGKSRSSSAINCRCLGVTWKSRRAPLLNEEATPSRDGAALRSVAGARPWRGRFVRLEDRTRRFTGGFPLRTTAPPVGAAAHSFSGRGITKWPGERQGCALPCRRHHLRQRAPHPTSDFRSRVALSGVLAPDRPSFRGTERTMTTFEVDVSSARRPDLAAFLRFALHAKLATVDEVVRWADEVVLEEP